MGATGTVHSKCCVLSSRITLGKWSGDQSFVISDKVTRYDMVLGRDFLKHNNVIVDHGNDVIKIKDLIIDVNSLMNNTVDVSSDTDIGDNQISDSAGDLNEHGDGIKVNVNPLAEYECKAVGDHIIKPNSQKLVSFRIDDSFNRDQNNLICFEGRDISQYGCLIAKSLHDCNSQVYFCNVLNSSNNSVRIKNAGVIGKVMSCVLASEYEESKLNSMDNSAMTKQVHFEQPSDVSYREHRTKLKHINSLNLGLNLNDDQRNKLLAVLYKNHNYFAWDENSLGRTNLVEHKVPTGDSKPIEQYQYPIPTIAKEAMREQVEDMLKKGIIQDSASSWCSPVLLIKKILPDNSVKYRFCIDLRKVNDLTAKDCYSLPRIDETVDALGGSVFFSSMDIDRAFWQVVMADEDKHKFAFRVDGRLLEPNVMPFGSKNAPATFQRLLDKVLRGLTWKQCLVYIDDILVFGRSFEEHLTRLDAVLARIGEAGLLLKPEKCEFGKSEVKYLGFEISDKGLRPSQAKVAKLLATEPPKTTKVLHSFMCSINYYRTLIPLYSQLTARLLTMSTSKEKICKWAPETIEDFNNLKKSLANAPILVFPNFDKVFVLQCDASKFSIGGVCLQQYGIKLFPVMFFGRKLTAVEIRYSTTERELLAIVYAYLACYHLVYGRKIIFGTDHKPLVTLCKLKRPFDRLGRLLNHLMGVDYTLEYIPGPLNYLADFMSRVIIQDGTSSPSHICNINSIKLESSVNWVNEQSRDVAIQNVIQCIKNKSIDKAWLNLKSGSSWLRERKFLYIVQNVLMHGSSKIVVPEHFVNNILKLFHDSPFAGHRGFGSTVYAISCRYFWIRLYTDVKEYCRSCHVCQIFNYPNLTGRAPLIPILTSRPGEFVHLDYMGPFKVSRAGNKYICLAVDAHIKYLWFACTRTIDEISTALFLFSEIVCKVGPVENIVSDQGACFESNVFKHLCILIGSNKLRSSAYHPSGNGVIEVVNRVIKPNLAKYVSNSHDDWDLCLPLAVNSYNNTVHSSIGITPHEAMFNRPPVLLADIICNNKLPKETNASNVSDFTMAVYKNAIRVRNEISFNKAAAQAKQKAAYDQYVKNSRIYLIGDLVKLKNYSKAKPGFCQAFIEKSVGPYKVIKQCGDSSYRIQDDMGNSQVVHYDRLSPYKSREHVPNDNINYASPLRERIDVVKHNDLASNMRGFGGLVYLYKKKLGRVAARTLIDSETEDNLEIDPNINNDSFESASEEINVNVEAVASVGVNTVLNNVNLGTNGSEHDFMSLENFKSLFTLSCEKRLNTKGKTMAMCLGCLNWYEKLTGLRIHKLNCTKPVPRISAADKLVFDDWVSTLSVHVPNEKSSQFTISKNPTTSSAAQFPIDVTEDQEVELILAEKSFLKLKKSSDVFSDIDSDTSDGSEFDLNILRSSPENEWSDEKTD